MKRIFAIVIFAAACSVATGATPTTEPQAARQQEPKSLGQQPGHAHASGDNKHGTHHPVLPKPNRTHAAPNNQSHIATSRNVRQSAAGKPSQFASTGRPTGNPVNNTRSRETSALSRTSVPTLNDPRHHGPNPPSVGGPALRHNANSGMISGNGVKRRP